MKIFMTESVFTNPIAAQALYPYTKFKLPKSVKNFLGSGDKEWEDPTNLLDESDEATIISTDSAPFRLTDFLIAYNFNFNISRMPRGMKFRVVGHTDSTQNFLLVVVPAKFVSPSGWTWVGAGRAQWITAGQNFNIVFGGKNDVWSIANFDKTLINDQNFGTIFFAYFPSTIEYGEGVAINYVKERIYLDDDT